MCSKLVVCKLFESCEKRLIYENLPIYVTYTKSSVTYTKKRSVLSLWMPYEEHTL